MYLLLQTALNKSLPESLNKSVPNYVNAPTSHTSMCETSDVKQCTQKQAGEHRIRNSILETGATGSCKAGGGLHAGEQGAGH